MNRFRTLCGNWQTEITNYSRWIRNTLHCHLKKGGRYWSVRVGIHYRALAVEVDEGLLWIWIGSHSEYDKLIGG